MQNDDEHDTHMDVFVYVDPVRVDILAVCGTSPDSGQHMHVWTGSASDVDGCVSLDAPRPLRVPSPLKSPWTPVLCLLDEMAAEGFEPVRVWVLRAPGGPMQFDIRAAASKRA